MWTCYGINTTFHRTYFLLGRLFDGVDLIMPWQSRRNNAGLKCPSIRTCVAYVRIRTSVHKKFLRFQWNVELEVDEWCTMVCSMTRSKIKVTSRSKLEIRLFSNGVASWAQQRFSRSRLRRESYHLYIWSFGSLQLIFLSWNWCFTTVSSCKWNVRPHITMSVLSFEWSR